MSRKVTKEEFLEKLNSIHPNQFELIGDFHSASTRTLFRCHCGNEFESIPKRLYDPTRIGCAKCCYKNRSQPNKISKDDFLKKLKEIYPEDDYELMDEFKGYETKMHFKHKCGNIIECIPHTLVGSSSPFKYCIHCNPIKNRTYDIKEIKDFIEKDNQYTLISDKYINNKSKIKIKHNKCKGIFEMSFNRFQCGDQCPICNGHQRYPKEKFIKEFKKNNKNYEMVSEYKSLSKPLKIKHKNCGKEFTINEARRSYPNCKCPFCYPNISKGESTIKEFLERNNIEFEQQKKFDTCKYKNKLPFDFYLPEYRLLIEFDGQQHFENIFGFYGDEDFKLTQKRDRIKNKWVKDSKKYRLIRIRYDQNPNDILKQILLEEKDLDELDDVFYVFNE